MVEIDLSENPLEESFTWVLGGLGGEIPENVAREYLRLGTSLEARGRHGIREKVFWNDFLLIAYARATRGREGMGGETSAEVFRAHRGKARVKVLLGGCPRFGL